jgi:hypothetical protein
MAAGRWLMRWSKTHWPIMAGIVVAVFVNAI